MELVVGVVESVVGVVVEGGVSSGCGGGGWSQ